jgi:hypothetical protein
MAQRRGLLNVVCRVIGVLSDLGVCCRRLAVAGGGFAAGFDFRLKSVG